MKFVVQRVKNAQVDIEGKTVGKIEKGFMEKTSIKVICFIK